ncbi:sulfatase family protein [Alienimonas californiensis]|uniref:Choline-sulfatase n=1 Tax=Alienimonas californiensis TaxID=2527989 RepID=A0A517P3V5_9PLAN|nr:sulfatase [Alienimonas californiensis]QDT14051.1 Choline-sulfatase [Alienimonas californiensis]
MRRLALALLFLTSGGVAVGAPQPPSEELRSDAAQPAAQSEGEAADRPNILFAFADDWGRYAGAYAALDGDARNDLSKATGFATPNFDQIAGNGVLFTHAYVNAPSCTPCRSSLLTGRPFYTTGLGAILNGAQWDGSIKSYPEALEEGGYFVGQTYKVWSPGTPNDAPIGGNRTAYEKAGGRFNGFSKIVSKANDPDAAGTELYKEVLDNFTAFLKDAEDSGKPWHYWFGPTNVHRTWAQGSGKKIWGIEPDSLKGKMPPFLPDVPEVRQDFADYLGEVMAFDNALGVLLKELKDRGELENTVIAVSGDHGAPGFPRGKTNLYDFGVAVPLAIAGPGVSAGLDANGRVVTDFVTLPDLAPTFLDIAGVPLPEGMTAHSLAPVLVTDEEDRVDEARDAAFFGRERHVASAREGYLPYPQRGIRTDDYLYIRNFAPDRWPQGTAPGYGLPGEMPDERALNSNTRAAFPDVDAGPTKAWTILHRDDNEATKRAFELGYLRRPGEELYAIAEDPHQMKNLADDPAHAQAKAELSARLMEHLKANGDPRVTGDGSTFDKPPFAAQEGYERLQNGGMKRSGGG